jgi:16S rRNA (cytidine1402-2'-O)-methyltransferase
MNKLYLVPSPIGNLEDITLRALEVLKDADTILAEDTRKSGFLLSHFGISKRIEANHKFNEHRKLQGLVERILSGEKIALLSDAGTPGISDPGFLLVRACLENGIEVETLPGATAFVPALVNSGLPCERFCFEGFLPQKKGRNKRLTQLQEEERTMIFYESPFRLVKTLQQLAESFGSDRRASVSRELTKLYEETVRGTLSGLTEHFQQGTVKGEIVLVVEGKGKKHAGKQDETED